jgi:hypothetical protein
MEKHMPYFNVLEALQKTGGCALCTLEKRTMHSYFEAFLYENVNSAGSREPLRESRGYCPHHAHALVGFHDVLALSILYKDQALLAADFLRKAVGGGNLFSEWSRHGTCPACRQALEIRGHYVGILAEGLKEAEMRRAFTDRFNVCLNHLLLLMDALGDDAFKAELAEKMEKRMAGLAGRLEQYCQDCQKNAEGEVVDSPHRFAWKEAVEGAVGQEGVFEPL